MSPRRIWSYRSWYVFWPHPLTSLPETMWPGPSYVKNAATWKCYRGLIEARRKPAKAQNPERDPAPFGWSWGCDGSRRWEACRGAHCSVGTVFQDGRKGGFWGDLWRRSSVKLLRLPRRPEKSNIQNPWTCLLQSYPIWSWTDVDRTCIPSSFPVQGSHRNDFPKCIIEHDVYCTNGWNSS